MHYKSKKHYLILETSVLGLRTYPIKIIMVYWDIVEPLLHVQLEEKLALGMF